MVLGLSICLTAPHSPVLKCEQVGLFVFCLSSVCLLVFSYSLIFKKNIYNLVLPFYFLSCCYLHFVFIPLYGLSFLQDFLTLLRLYPHAFSVPFKGNCDPLWCYIQYKGNILYLNFRHLNYALSFSQLLDPLILGRVFKSVEVTSNQKTPRKNSYCIVKQSRIYF